jgi:hypothetical protein
MGRLKILASPLRKLDTRIAKPAPKTADPFYLTSAWRNLIDRIVKQRGRKCEDTQCLYPWRTGIRVFGDHIVELKDGGAPLDESNIMLRCGSCHTRKTAAERRRRQASE